MFAMIDRHVLINHCWLTIRQQRELRCIVDISRGTIMTQCKKNARTSF